jgi:hypothetical protein
LTAWRGNAGGLKARCDISQGDCATILDGCDGRGQIGRPICGALVVGGCARLLRPPADYHTLPVALADASPAKDSAPCLCGCIASKTAM